MTAHPPDDESRFAAWLTEHGVIPRKLSLAYTFEAADAEELHQEMLVQLWRSLPRFRGQTKPRPGSTESALTPPLPAGARRGSSRRAASRRRGLPRGQPGGRPRTQRPAHGPDGCRARTARPLERSLLVLALDGLGHREIGEITGLNENHVGVALPRARRKLATLMKGVVHEL